MMPLEKIDRYSTVILTNSLTGEILFEEYEGPNSKLATFIFSQQDTLAKLRLNLYVNQLGLAIANLCQLLNINLVQAKTISRPAKERLDQLKISYNDDVQLIDLIFSSKNANKVCPLEASLVGHSVESSLNILRQPTDSPACQTKQV